jgi:hypothetical protein
MADIAARLRATSAALAQRYPGDRAGQPIHTVYVCAADASHDLPQAWGSAAIELADRHSGVLAELGEPELLSVVRETLAQRPIQDLRLDFEDGYGARGDEAEDRDAARAVSVLEVEP